MDHILPPMLLYSACALGAVGVALALPTRRGNPFLIGGLVAAVAMGIALIGLAGAAPAQVPNVHFYLFSAIALFGAIKVISHPRPVYSALFFILTILASCGLYLILSAEFMAFALIIVYAGAILITYLFVIMLATEAPSNDAVEALAEYDRFSREPVSAVLAGFALLAALTTVLAHGAVNLKADPALAFQRDAMLAVMPSKVERALASAAVAVPDPQPGSPDRVRWEPLVKEGERLALIDGRPAVYPKADGTGSLVVVDSAGAGREIPQSAWPKDLMVENVEGLAFTFIGDKPGAIEIAGVILLMAMLGAVVLARKKVELDDAAKRALAARMAGAQGSNGVAAREPVMAGVGGGA